MRPFLVCCLVLAACAQPRAAESQSPEASPAAVVVGPRTPEVLSELVPRLMAEHHVPGVGVALIRDGAIVWTGSFGVERAGTLDRVDATTVFEAASMSKPAYTYPFMKLVEEGAIELDTPLVRYLGHDYIEGDTLHRLITARMVLSHTTGFPNWRPDDGPLTVDFVPGTQVGYSGEGFQYLQTVVEAVTGQSMAAFTRERLLSRVWQEQSFVTGRSVDTLVKRLRKKIEVDPADPRLIVTVWGDGYKFAE